MSISRYSKMGGVELLHEETVTVANVAAGNAAGDVITEDAIIHTITIWNYGGQAAPKITVQDRASVPQSWQFGVNTIVGVGGSVMLESDKGIPATGGLNVVCDAASACKVKVIWRRS